MWWECLAWNLVRDKHLIAHQSYNIGWPNCLKCCGIMVDDLPGVQDTLVCLAVRDRLEERANTRHAARNPRLDYGADSEEVWLGDGPLINNGRLA
eukprot:10634480-Karenia_brevis.AAC.1